jgi:hypothetical protein
MAGLLTISRIAWRTSLLSNGCISTAMHRGSQPPVCDWRTDSPPWFWATVTCEKGISVMASICPPKSAFTCAVASEKSMMVTVSKYGSPERQ